MSFTLDDDVTQLDFSDIRMHADDFTLQVRCSLDRSSRGSVAEGRLSPANRDMG